MSAASSNGPSPIVDSFFAAAQELGMWTASRLYLREMTREGGAPAIEAARELLGQRFPIFDAAASEWLESDGASSIDIPAALRALEGVARLLVVGVDVDPLDALVDGVDPATRIGLVAGVGELSGDLSRVLANYQGRVALVGLADVPRWIGRKSALATVVYGVDSNDMAYTSLAWLRVLGPDTRTQFRTLLGINVLERSPSIHPRWVVATPADDFSALV
ncbi:MAG: hypothetical protein JNK05_00065 [Myxococcales bacterium]|nr:hypothetical protein [Myxococcales bacterium]